MDYFIADTHFGHEGCLNWPNGKARSFKTIEEMHSTIINNWNSVVSDEDNVYLLGDAAYKCSPVLIKTIFKELKGNIIFIEGNHDKRFLKIKEITDKFKGIHKILELVYDKTLIVLCHYPIYSWKDKHHGSIHLHGHVHGQSTGITGNILDVSCEALNYTPISIIEILQKFNKISNTNKN